MDGASYSTEFSDKVHYVCVVARYRAYYMLFTKCTKPSPSNTVGGMSGLCHRVKNQLSDTYAQRVFRMPGAVVMVEFAYGLTETRR